MGVKFSNNARSRLAASISAVATTITVQAGHGIRFPILIEDEDWFPLAIENANGDLEYVRCTFRIGDALTVARGEEGTQPRAFNAGDMVQLRLTERAVALSGLGGGGGGGYYADGTDINALRPAAKGATVGAPAGTKVGNRPVEEVLNQFDQAKDDITDLIETYGSVATAAASAQTAAQARDNAEVARQQSAAAASAAAAILSDTSAIRDSVEVAKSSAESASALAQSYRDQSSQSASTAAGSASAASQNATLSAQARGTAQEAAAASLSYRDQAVASSTAAGQSATVSQNAAISASTAAQALMPADFGSITNWTEDWGGGTGSLEGNPRFQAYDDTLLGRVLQISNVPHFSPHLAAKGRATLIRDHVYRITVIWRLRGGQANDNSVNAALYAASIRADGAATGSAYTPISITSGSAGWGSSFATHFVEFSANSIIDAGYQWIRPLFRVDSQGYYFVQSLELRDITGEDAARKSAQAAATSASLATASQSGAAQSASASQADRVAAETAASLSSSYRDQAATAASNAAGSQSLASQSATLAAEARNAANNAAAASSQSASIASSRADEADQAATAAQFSQVSASTSAANALDRFARSFPGYVGPEGKDAYVYVGDNGAGFSFEYGPGTGWPQRYITAQEGGYGGRYNRITFKESMPKIVGRRYRATAWFYNNSTNSASVGIWILNTDNNVWDTAAVGRGGDLTPEGCVNGVPINYPGFVKVGIEFTIANDWKTLWKPIFEFATTGAAPNGLWHVTGITIEDITQEKAARDSASAAANSASSAAVSSSAAGTQAAAAQNSSVQATASAKTAADNANWSADTANWAADRANAAAGAADTANNRSIAASNSASAAASSTAVAAGHASAAQTSAILAASASLGSLNPNPTFADYPNASGEPAYWSGWDWNNGNVPQRISGEAGIGYAIREYAIAGWNQGGQIIGQGGLANPLGDQWYVMEAHIRLDSGSLRGAGVWANCASADGSQYRGDIGGINFAADPDSAGYVRGDGQGGKVYRFTKLLRGPTDPERITLYRFTNWDGFGQRNAKSLDWYRIALRPATQQEIRDQTALQPLIAQVSQQAGVLAAVDGRTQAYIEQVASAGGKRAAVRMVAGGSGSGIEFQADAIRLGDDNRPAMDVVDGNVIFYGKVTAESIETQHLRVNGVDFDRLGNGAVGTVKLQADAAQQIYAINSSSAFAGTAGGQTIVSYTFYTPYPAKLITSFSARGYYTGGSNPGGWFFYTRSSSHPGAYVANATGDPARSLDSFPGCPGAVGSVDIPAGTFTVDLVWGASRLTVQDVNLVIQVVKR